MRSFTHLFSASAAMSVSSMADGAAADASYTQQKGLVAFPLKASAGSVLVETKKTTAKRQLETELDPRLSGAIYTIDITLGTPGQTVSVQFDTGSAITWVNPLCSSSAVEELCRELGAFDKTESSTFVDLNQVAPVRYGMGGANIEYGHDVLAIGESRIEEQQFGIAYESEYLYSGIMGAGPDLAGWDSPHPFVIDNLFTQGLINSRVFSLDLRSIESDRGSVIFGGIDTSKYSGNLEKLPVVPAAEAPDGFTRWWVDVGGITVTRDGDDDVVILEGSQTFLLDSGYSLSGFPRPLMSALLEAFPDAQFVSNLQAYAVDCSLADVEGTLDFTFGSTVIKVPYKDFIMPQGEACFLGAFPSDDFPVLGDTVLRAAYVVYDWDNREIHIANNEDCGTDLVAVESGPDAVPSIEGGCSPTSTTTTSSKPTTTTSKTTSETKTATTTTSDDDDEPSPTPTDTDTAVPTSSEDGGDDTATEPPPTDDVPEHTETESHPAEPTEAETTAPPPPPPPPTTVPAPEPTSEESGSSPIPTPTTVPGSGAASVTIPGLLSVAVAVGAIILL